MTAPTVSVLLPTFNRARFLAEALDSVLGQTLPPRQVIVVDDGSTDSTPEILASYGDRIEVISRADNGGKPHALNLALPRARGDYVWVFDDDDVALPRSLERHLGVLESRPEVGFTYSAFQIAIAGPDGRIVEKIPKPLPEIPPGEVFVRMLEGNFMQQQAVLARRSCYREVGDYDTELISGEDYEMMLRMTRRFACAAIPEPTFLFRQHPGPRGPRRARYEAGQRVSRWIEDNRTILRRLHRELPLEEYLPRGGGHRFPPAGGLSPEDRRRALFQRMCVMARAGLWPAALDDLGAVAEEARQAGRAAPLDDAERRIVRLAVDRYIGRHVALESLIRDRGLQRRLAAFDRSPVLAEVRRIIGEGLGELARGAIAGKRFRLAAGAFVLAARCSLLGSLRRGFRRWSQRLAQE